jgi:hypothetical protein
MITVRTNSKTHRKHLYVDDTPLHNAIVSDQEDSYSVTSRDKVTSGMLAAHRFADFQLAPDYIQLWFYPDDLDHLDGSGTFINQQTNEQEEKILIMSFTFGGDLLTEWQAPYTFADYVHHIYPVIKIHDSIYEVKLYGKDNTSVSYDSTNKDDLDVPTFIRTGLHESKGGKIYSLEVTFIASPDKSIADEVGRFAKMFREIHKQATDYLSQTKRRSVVASFDDFPKEVRTYCEQYLMYFVQFLQDLGVDATSEIKHEAGKVLFTITPINEHEALDKIRTALDIYLSLPSSPISDSGSTEIAINRLESAVLRLQSDLRLAAAELQAKNATIEAQQLSINVQRSLLSGKIVPLQEETTENRKEFLGGAVALTVMKKEGVEVNLAKIYRMIKEMFIKRS